MLVIVMYMSLALYLSLMNHPVIQCVRLKINKEIFNGSYDFSRRLLSNVSNLEKYSVNLIKKFIKDKK